MKDFDYRINDIHVNMIEFENYIERGYEAFWLFTSRKEVKIQKDFTHSHCKNNGFLKGEIPALTD